MVNKKQTDEFLDWLAAGDEAEEETLKHQLGRHNQSRHGYRYGDNLSEDERVAFGESEKRRLRHAGASLDERIEYIHRFHGEAGAAARASARARSARRRDEARAEARIAAHPPLGSRGGHAQPNPHRPSSAERAALRAQHQRELEAHDRLIAAQAAQAKASALAAVQAAKVVVSNRPASKPVASKPAGVEAKKKPKTLPTSPYSSARNVEKRISKHLDENYVYAHIRLKGVVDHKSLVRNMAKTFEIYDKESDLRTEIISLSSNKEALRIEGVFKNKDGNSVGTFTREMHRDGNGRLLVHHNYFRLEKQYEGTGVGSRFVRHLEQKYKKMGVNQIYLLANLDVGGYAWARMGFDFAHKEDLSMYASNARASWLRRYGSAMPSSMVRSIKHAWDIAALRGPDGHNIGKEVLLGQNWDAAKILNGGPLLGFRVGEAYYDGKK